MKCEEADERHTLVCISVHREVFVLTEAKNVQM